MQLIHFCIHFDFIFTLRAHKGEDNGWDYQKKKREVSRFDSRWWQQQIISAHIWTRLINIFDADLGVLRFAQSSNLIKERDYFRTRWHFPINWKWSRNGKWNNLNHSVELLNFEAASRLHVSDINQFTTVESVLCVPLFTCTYISTGTGPKERMCNSSHKMCQAVNNITTIQDIVTKREAILVSRRWFSARFLDRLGNFGRKYQIHNVQAKWKVAVWNTTNSVRVEVNLLQEWML